MKKNLTLLISIIFNAFSGLKEELPTLILALQEQKSPELPDDIINQIVAEYIVNYTHTNKDLFFSNYTQFKSDINLIARFIETDPTIEEIIWKKIPTGYYINQLDKIVKNKNPLIEQIIKDRRREADKTLRGIINRELDRILKKYEE